MTQATLLELCDSFSDGDGHAFKTIVHGFTELPTSTVKDLARDCWVATSTVRRWSRGLAVPGPHVQAFVVRKIQTRLNAQAAW